MKDFELARREGFGRWCGFAALREQQTLELARQEQDLAGGRGAHRDDDVAESALLREMPGRAGPRDIGERDGAWVTGEHDDRGLRLRNAYRARELRAGAIGQVIVRENNVWPRVVQRGDRASDVVSHRDDVDVFRGAHRDAQQLREEPLVVDDHHADGVAHCSTSWLTAVRTCAPSAATTAGSISPRATAPCMMRTASCSETAARSGRSTSSASKRSATLTMRTSSGIFSAVSLSGYPRPSMRS